MTYEVTATRRRPQVFEDLVGQEFVTATLQNAIKNGKIAHAYLFSGPRGCGKTTSARILAKLLNCEKGPSATPCGECHSCTEIARGASLDVIEIDGASNTSVNDVRQIKDEVLFPPNSSRYKIYIIDEVHMLSTSAFNALLKTIEEPPPYVVFIFATTELHKVPATIKSRCQQFHFRLGSVEQIKNLLAAAAADSNIQADDEALYWIARESTGSFRDAYTLFDQVAAFSDGYITYEKIRDKLGLVGVDRLNDLYELCVDGNTGAALEKIDEMLQGGVSVEQFISNSADYVRNLLLIKNGIRKESLLGQAAGRFSEKVLAAWNTVQLERALSLFLQLFRDIRYSLSPRFELELAVSRLSWLASYVTAADVRNAIGGIRPLLNGTAAGSAAGQPGIPSQNTPIVHAPETPSAGAVRQPDGMPKFRILDEIKSGSPAGDPGTAVPGFVPDGENRPFQASGYRQTAEATAAVTADNTPAVAGQFAPSLAAGSVPAFAANSVPQIAAVQSVPASDSGSVLQQATVQSVEELRESLIRELSISRAILASAVAKTEKWQLAGNVLTVTSRTAFLKSQLEREISIIKPALAGLWGSPLEFSVLLEEVKPVDESLSLPGAAGIVASMFSGKCVAVMDRPAVQSESDLELKIESDKTGDDTGE